MHVYRRTWLEERDRLGRATAAFLRSHGYGLKWPYVMRKTLKRKHCTVRSTRQSLIGCSKNTEQATPSLLLTRLDSNVFGLAG